MRIPQALVCLPCRAPDPVRSAGADPIHRGSVAYLLAVFVIGLLFWAPATPGAAPPSQYTHAPESVTTAQLEAAIKRLKGASELDQGTREQALKLYQQALGELEAAAESVKKAEHYERALKEASSKTSEVDESIATLSGRGEQPPPVRLPANPSLEELERLLAEEQGALAARQDRFNELTDRINLEQVRPTRARAERERLKTSLDKVNAELRTLEEKGLAPTVQEAQRAQLLARRQALLARSKALDKERSSYTVRSKFLASQQELAHREYDQAQKDVKFLKERVNRRRELEAVRTIAKAEQAKQEVSGKHPVIVELAEHNAMLSRELAALVAETDSVDRKRTQLHEQLKGLENDFRAVQQQVSTGAGGAILGDLLLAKRKTLPDVGGLAREAAVYTREASELRLKLYRLRTEHSLLSNPQAFVEDMMSSKVGPEVPVREGREIRSEALRLLNDREELLERIREQYRKYLLVLTDVAETERRLVELVAEYSDLLDRQLIWIPNAVPIGAAWWDNATQSARWLFDAHRWAGEGTRLWRGFLEAPLRSAVVLAGVVLLLASRPYLRRRLERLAEQASGVLDNDFLYTLKALGITVLVSVPLPILMLYAGLVLHSPAESKLFYTGLSGAFTRLGGVLWFLLFVIESARPRGLAEAHFGWSESIRRLLRRELLWFPAVLLPMGFLMYSTGWPLADPAQDAVGRVVFVAIMLAMSVLAAVILRPGYGCLSGLVGPNPHGWRWLVRYIGYPALVVLPLGLAVLAVLGYAYTAVVLSQRVANSVVVAVSGVYLYYLIERWLVIALPRLAMERARAKREAMVAAREAREAVDVSGQAVPGAVEVPGVNLATAGAQTQRFLRLGIVLYISLGLWWVWSDLVPALGILDDVRLWSYTVKSEGAEQLLPVTLADLLLGVLIGVLTFAAFGNLPGVLEVMGLQRLRRIDAGTREAITALTRYAIAAAGVLVALSILGIRWGQVQWLVAAMSVGLGFGLQEIFANFVSGIIVLVERPIRVGDAVTIGNLSGVVSRIRLRTTTIADWDNKELIVPNKAFVTDQLVNWTLSSPITRVIVRVGVAYGSDTDLVHRVMLETARANPKVLTDPWPTVLFLGFGESSLDFEVRVFVKDRQERMPLLHELHMAIDKALREHDIEIPFPQRDLHLRSVDPGIGLPGSGPVGVGSARASRKER